MWRSLTGTCNGTDSFGWTVRFVAVLSSINWGEEEKNSSMIQFQQTIQHTSRPSNRSMMTSFPVPFNNDNIGRLSSSVGGRRLL